MFVVYFLIYPDVRNNSYDVVTTSQVSTGGGPSHEPRVSEWALADEVGGMNLAFGVLAALVSRATTGVGQQLQTSQLGAMIELQVNGSGLTRASLNTSTRAHRSTHLPCSCSSDQWRLAPLCSLHGCSSDQY